MHIFRRKAAFTMQRWPSGSLVHHAEDAKGETPLSTPPANEQRRCAEKTSRISKAQGCLHHAEAAQGFSRSLCGGCKGETPLSTPPANEQRRCAAKTSRTFKPHGCLHHAEAAHGSSRSLCAGSNA